MKSISLSIVAILIIGIFAIAFVIAEEQAVETSDDSIIEVAVDNSVNTAIQESLADSQSGDNDVKIIGMKKVTLTEGWIVSKNNSNAQILTGLWISGTYAKANASQVKQTRDQNKGNKTKIKEELKKISTETILLAHGRIHIGFGSDMEKFRLFKKGITNNSASFYVIPINNNAADENEAKNLSIGIFEVTNKKYPSLTLWNGKLVINSGKYSGEWTVSTASKTKLLKKVAKGEEKQNKQDDSENQSQKNIKNNQSEKKPGFFKRIIFWGKNK